MITLDQGGAGAKMARIVPPPDRLARRVECLWVERPADFDVPRQRVWRIVPDHCGHLLYHRIGGRTRLSLVGPRTRPVDVGKGRRRLSVGARIRPWALSALFGVSPRELRDRSFALRDVLGRVGADLEERLDESAEDQVHRVMAEWLGGRVAVEETPSERRARASSLLLRDSESCGQVADQLGLSARALRTVMGSHVGLSPKTYARIVRLHRALERAGSREAWSSVALASGYYDQAHMIREFQSLLGESPEVWRGRGMVGGPAGSATSDGPDTGR